MKEALQEIHHIALGCHPGSFVEARAKTVMPLLGLKLSSPYTCDL
jgi:hypothetical protein